MQFISNYKNTQAFLACQLRKSVVFEHVAIPFQPRSTSPRLKGNCIMAVILEFNDRNGLFTSTGHANSLWHAPFYQVCVLAVNKCLLFGIDIPIDRHILKGEVTLSRGIQINTDLNDRHHTQRLLDIHKHHGWLAHHDLHHHIFRCVISLVTLSRTSASLSQPPQSPA